MSILACTIGALMFLLVTLAMSRVEASGALEAERSARDNRPQTTPAEDDRRAAALRAEIEELERGRVALAKLDATLAAQGFDTTRSFLGIQDQLNQRRRSTDNQRRLDALIREAALAKRKRGEVETSIATLESRREALPILIDPTGLSRRQKPFFIECDAGGATLYRVRDDFEYFVSRSELSTSGDFGRYLRRTRAIPGALIVLLVRKDGIATSTRVEGLARNAGIRIARLPLPGAGPLDLRLLRAAEGAAPKETAGQGATR